MATNETCATMNKRDKILPGNSIDDYRELISNAVACWLHYCNSLYVPILYFCLYEVELFRLAGLAEVQWKTLNGDDALLDMTTMTSSPYTARPPGGWEVFAVEQFYRS